MIIEARDDVLTLSGSLDKNLWPSIESAASLLLRMHPSGILVDASGLTHITPEGSKTFLDAMAYIERYRARIVLCRVPEAAMRVIQHVPVVRSQVPIAQTCEQARASLALAAAARERGRRLGRRAASDGRGVSPRIVLVPLLRGSHAVPATLTLATQLGTFSTAADSEEQKTRLKVKPRFTVSYILEVPRAMPLTAPFPEEEEAANALLNEASGTASELGVEIQAGVERTRDVNEEIMSLAARIKADMIALALPSKADAPGEVVDQLVGALIARAGREVVLYREK